MTDQETAERVGRALRGELGPVRVLLDTALLFRIMPSEADTAWAARAVVEVDESVQVDGADRRRARWRQVGPSIVPSKEGGDVVDLLQDLAVIAGGGPGRLQHETPVATSAPVREGTGILDRSPGTAPSTPACTSTTRWNAGISRAGHEPALLAAGEAANAARARPSGDRPADGSPLGASQPVAAVS